MFAHPDEINEHERQGARKMSIVVPSATYSGKQIVLMLLVFAAFASVILCFFD